MTDGQGRAVRAFISHASEDKERFVMPFAEALLAAGVDAWVDKWEMGPGDSLVQKIFEDGIAQADAFIVVLSHVSVLKPWVAEELDAGVVRRISSGRATKLIPVVLDEGVVVPAALRHLLWESVPQKGLHAVVQRVVDQLQGTSRKPPLGPKPTYTGTTPRWATNSADETVFELIIDELAAHDSRGWILFSNDVQDRAAAVGISKERFIESMYALIDKRLINATVMAGGVRFLLKPCPDRVWLQVQEDKGLDVAALRQELLAAIVNKDQRDLRPQDFGSGHHTLGAILRSLESDRIITASSVNNDSFMVTSVSPLARRALEST